MPRDDHVTMTMTQPGAPAVPHTPDGGRRPPSLIRAAFYAVTVSVLVWATIVVPLPLVEFVPGQPTSIPSLVEIEGVETTPIAGDAALLTVLLRQPSTAEAVSAWVSPQRRVALRASVIPQDIEESEYFEAERERFRATFGVAVAVGAQAAGVEAVIETSARVAGVLPDGPSAGILEVGDVVIGYQGEEIETAEQLRDLTAEGTAGDRVEVTVLRDTDEVTTTIELGQARGMDRPGLGVMIETVPGELRLPFEAALAEDTRIGGPSAGLMIALTVYDLLSDEDLIAGRVVVGTGAIDARGRVGNVGGISEKLRAAEAYGADVVLLPTAGFEALEQEPPAGLRVIPVGTLEQAIEALRQ